MTRYNRQCPSCGEKKNPGGCKQCVRCHYAFVPVKMRSANCRIENIVSIPSTPSCGFSTMNAFSSEDTIIQNILPDNFKWLGCLQLKDIHGKPVGAAKYYAQAEGFNGGKPFYANDKRKIVSLAYCVMHRGLKSIPNDFKKCGVSSE